MRVRAEVPAWMIADGEYGDVAAGARGEFGFALVPTSVTGATGPHGFRQPDRSARTVASGVVVQHSRHVPPVLDDGNVLPVLATAGNAPEVGAELEVDGRLLVEPFLWVADGPLWAAIPDGVRLWAVAHVYRCTAGRTTALEALPGVEEVDHGASYLVELVR